MKNIKLLVLSLFSICLTSGAVMAQQSESDEQVKGQMRVKVIKNENGNIEEFDETFSIEDEKKIQEILKEHGVEMSAEELKKVHKHKMYKSSADNDKTGIMKVKIIKGEDGEMKEVNEEFSNGDREKMKEMLEKHGIEISAEDMENAYQFNAAGEIEGKKVMVKTMRIDSDEDLDVKVQKYILRTDTAQSLNDSVIVRTAKYVEFRSEGDIGEGDDVKKEVRVFKFDSKDIDMDKEQMDDKFFEDIKKAAEEGDAERIMEMVYSRGNWQGADEKGGTKKVLVRYKLTDVCTDNMMMFFRKKSEGKPSKEIPTTIDQSFENNSSIEQIKLFPNPTNDYFNMNFVSKKPQDYQLTITDTKGSKIFEKQLNSFEGSYNEEFDLSKYEKGLYFFNLTSEDEVISKKVIVL